MTAGVLARPANRATLGHEPTDMRIDINTADAHRLQLLPGVGPTLAANIIDYRRRHGPFTQQADLQTVHRIGPTIASNIESWIEMKGSGQH